jgi:hypothetical protein
MDQHLLAYQARPACQTRVGWHEVNVFQPGDGGASSAGLWRTLPARDILDDTVWKDYANRTEAQFQNKLVVIRPTEVQLLQTDPIGEGSSGHVFRCIVRGQKCAVKIPLNVRPSHNTLPNQNLFSSSNQEMAFEFKLEQENARRMLEPDAYRAWRTQAPRRKRGDEVSHTMTHDDFVQIQNEWAEMRQHPGFAHMNPVLHVELNAASYPMLFSELCEGTLDTLVHGQPDEFGIPSLPCAQQWATYANQLIDAYNYMKYRDFMHVDFNYVNIFVKGSMLVLGDFGLCFPSETLVQNMGAQQWGLGSDHRPVPAWQWTGCQLAKVLRWLARPMNENDWAVHIEPFIPKAVRPIERLVKGGTLQDIATLQAAIASFVIPFAEFTPPSLRSNPDRPDSPPLMSGQRVTDAEHVAAAADFASFFNRARP